MNDGTAIIKEAKEMRRLNTIWDKLEQSSTVNLLINFRTDLHSKLEDMSVYTEHKSGCSGSGN